MVIFPIIIVLSLVLYVYYKVTLIRSKDRLEQSYLNAKSRIFLGSFIFFFGINQYVFYQTKLALFITIIFIFLGGLQLYTGWKEARHYRRQWKRNNSRE
ncbi:YtpI family protein [Virgibacillus sp. W0181]|uniref:YtpI family protein n=1 Tax=Virgibacillus sp. W0181 TaxID=3391581 RepID=UPI003F462EBB